LPEPRPQQSCRLTRYATATRYPGLEEPVTEREHAEAVEIAEAVLRWAESLL
jgi:HEPN domain-containing protein